MLNIRNIKQKLLSKKLYDLKNERIWQVVKVEDDYKNEQYIIQVESKTRVNSIYAPQTKTVFFQLYRTKHETLLTLPDDAYRLYDRCSPYMLVYKTDLTTINNFIRVLEKRLEGII